MSESMRDRIRDELAGWVIGSGYYATAVSVEDARDMADAVLAVLAYPPADVIEQAAIELFRDSWGDRPSAVKAGVRWNWLHDEEKQYWRSKVGLVFAAAFGGEQGE